jgi:hypothetical protein
MLQTRVSRKYISLVTKLTRYAGRYSAYGRSLILSRAETTMKYIRIRAPLDTLLVVPPTQSVSSKSCSWKHNCSIARMGCIKM